MKPLLSLLLPLALCCPAAAENWMALIDDNFRYLSSGIRSIEAGVSAATAAPAVCDLLGRRTTTPRKGIYIHGRRKIVVP